MRHTARVHCQLRNASSAKHFGSNSRFNHSPRVVIFNARSFIARTGNAIGNDYFRYYFNSKIVHYLHQGVYS